VQSSPPDTSTLPTDCPRPNGYEHLAPLFAERVALPDADPRRHRLRDDLVGGYLPVAQHIARKYRHRGESPDDLTQVARLGLVLAIDRFDPCRGVDFLSFAVPTINGEVQRYFRDRVMIIRLPRRLRELHSLICDAAGELAQRHGRSARPSEIATVLGLELETVLEGLQSQNGGYTFSLDEPARDDADWFGDRVRFSAALRHDDPASDLVEYRESVGPLLAQLSERDRSVLLLRFFGGMTQTEIGAQLGVSQMHVSRLLTRSLSWLRRKLAE
jgi:RNA polymerase sigma-B factor